MPQVRPAAAIPTAPTALLRLPFLAFAALPAAQGPSGEQLTTTHESVMRALNDMLRAAQQRRELRKERLQAIEDYIGFATSKVTGFGLLGVGAIETLDPSLLPLVIQQPTVVFGIGLGLLVGKKAVDIAAKVLEATRGK